MTTEREGFEWQRKTATLRVTFHIDAETVRGAEKLLDAWLAPQEDDDQLISYEVDDSWTNRP